MHFYSIVLIFQLLGVFTLIISLLENPKVPHHVITIAAQLLLQIVQHSTLSARKFQKTGGIHTILKLVISPTDGRSNSAADSNGQLDRGFGGEVVLRNLQRPIVATMGLRILAALLLSYMEETDDVLFDRANKGRSHSVAVETSRRKSHASYNRNRTPSYLTFFQGEGVSQYCENDVASEGEDSMTHCLSKPRKAWESLEILPTELARFAEAILEGIARELCNYKLQFATPTSEPSHKKPIFGIRRNSSANNPITGVDMDFLLSSMASLAYIAAEQLQETVEPMFRAGVMDVMSQVLEEITNGRAVGKDAVDLARLVSYSALTGKYQLLNFT